MSNFVAIVGLFTNRQINLTTISLLWVTISFLCQFWSYHTFHKISKLHHTMWNMPILLNVTISRVLECILIQLPKKALILACELLMRIYLILETSHRIFITVTSHKIVVNKSYVHIFEDRGRGIIRKLVVTQPTSWYTNNQNVVSIFGIALKEHFEYLGPEHQVFLLGKFERPFFLDVFMNKLQNNHQVQDKHSFTRISY